MITKEIINQLSGTLFNIKLNVGDIIKLSYKITEGEKERTQIYEGLIISIKNSAITLRQKILGIGVEQIINLYSPKIISITKKDKIKTRRAKLYFFRNKLSTKI